MRYLLIVASLMLASCAHTVPVVAKFPDAPPELLKQCDDLKQMEAGKTSIIDLLRTVVENYQLYYACGNRVEGWQDWHKKQKEIFENVGKE